jgi:colanic acid/amylovoran biosynthesis glycosyltransferase
MSKVNVLYLTNSLNANSETFIQNTIKQIDSVQSINLILFTFERSNYYLFRNTFLFKLYRIFTKFNFRFFRFKLLDYLVDVDYDIVFIDFGNNACELFDYFEGKHKKVVAHLHGFDISKLLISQSYRNWLVEFTQSNVIIVPSNYNLNRLEILGCKRSNIHAIPYAFYGIISEVNDIKEIKYDLIFVGRFVAKKDPRILMYTLNEVVKINPNVKLCLVGSGYLKSEILKLIKEFKLESNVILKGSVMQSEVYDLLNKSKIYVQHSVTSLDGDQEGFPNSILEASSLGLPVVSTIHAGIPEIVIDGKTGFLVQEFDYSMMAQRILELLNDEQLRRNLGDNGQKYILDKCNPIRRINDIEQLILKHV